MKMNEAALEHVSIYHVNVHSLMISQVLPCRKQVYKIFYFIHRYAMIQWWTILKKIKSSL